MRSLSFLRGRLVSLAAVAAVSLLAGAAEAAPSRTIFHGGTVFTSNPGALWAQAIAVEDGRVIAVGSNAAVLARANHHTRVIDLGGRVVIPGLNDAHVHVVVPQGAYLNAPTFVPGPGPGLAEIEGILAGGASATPPGSWLFAFYGSAIFDDDQANRFALDTVSPDHPVVLFGWTGHGMLFNSKAMEMLGISETEPDPYGGHFVRVPGSNVITGEAHEYAEFGIRRRLLDLLSDADIVDQYRVFADQAARLGYTSLQDMAIGLTQERTLSVLGAAKLPLRVRSICFPLTPGEDCEVTCEPNEKKGALVRASGTKWITDGTPIERLAFVETPYADRPGWVGAPDLPPGALQAVLEAHRHGAPARNQVLFHAVGDAAVGGVLDALEDTGGKHVWRHRRTRIEHGDLFFPWDFGRARELGVVVVENPTHFAVVDVFAERFTPAVLADLEPMQSLLEEDIPLALGTDGIGTAQSPFLNLFLAMIHPTHPTEALTLEQALIAFTRGAAYAEFEEDKKGTLTHGRAADLVVLSQDIFHVPPPAIPATESVLTMVNGRVIWDAGVLHAAP